MWERQPVDWNLGNEPDPADRFQTTIGRKVSVTGPGTFLGKASRTLTLEPTSASGWWFERKDVQESLPIRVSIRNVWTTARNIVLRSGSPHNYMRMVEHIIALKLGMGLDNLVIRTDSGDPPLFDRGSMDLVEAVEEGGIVEQKEPVSYVTVSERVTLGGRAGVFDLIPGNPARPAFSWIAPLIFQTLSATAYTVFSEQGMVPLRRLAHKHKRPPCLLAHYRQAFGIFATSVIPTLYDSGKRRYINLS